MEEDREKVDSYLKEHIQGTYETESGPIQYREDEVISKQNNDGFAIASLIFGILSLVLFCICVNYIFAILAIVFGVIHLVKNKESGKGMAIAGIITSIISIVIAIVFAIIFATAMQRVPMNEIEQEFEFQQKNERVF